ncbi:MAG: hypothetical protein JW857_07150 [Bacteroidales bacterium]|nr:hypothetical protein [Bacteroidales bacterium]
MQKRALILFLVGFHFLLNGQTIIDTDHFNNPLPFEHIHFFTDRDLYLSGEPIWFRADIQLDKHTTDLSKIIYVELFNAEQKSIVHKKYRINQNQAQGVLEIPSEFLSGTYYIRAYTNYSKNFSVDNYFLGAVQIINPRIGLPPLEKGNKKDAIRTEIQENIAAPISISTQATNNGQQIVSISQQKALPANKNYTLELANNQVQTLSQTEFQFNGLQTQIVLPKSKIGFEGLYYLILKDETGDIVAINAYCTNETASKEAQFSGEETHFKKRQKVSIPINKWNANEYTTLGIKVVQKGTVFSQMEKFKSYLDEPNLLFSFLKTQFNPKDLTSTEQEIILQTLNNKLKEKDFRSLFYTLKPTQLKWIPEVRDIGLSGIVVNKRTQEPLENVPVYLSIFKKNPQIHIYESRKDGSFFFSLNNFENEQDVFLCPLFENADELELKVNKDFYPVFPKLKALPLSIDSTDTDLIELMMIAAQTAKAYELIPMDQDKSISHLPYSFENPQISVVLDDYIETPTLEIVFKELVPSVRVKKRKDIYSLAIFDSERELYYNDPLILVDEVPVFNVNELLKISPKDIEKIEVHKSPFILGDHTINGIIMIRTFTDNFGGMVMPKSSTFFEYQTLSPSFKFKAIQYDNPSALNSRKGDFRTLLYWNPFLLKNNPISFYTSDQSGDYEVYIFGKQNNGQSINFKAFDLKVTE